MGLRDLDFFRQFQALERESPCDRTQGSKPLLAVSLLIPARGAGEALRPTVQKAVHYLEMRFKDSFEIIIIPNRCSNDFSDRTLEIAQELAEKNHNIRVCQHNGPQGKGAALKSGFKNSKGQWIFFTDADLPYDLSFFDKSTSLLNQGVDFVTGNRRLLNSHFQVPVSVLPMAYGRHRLGLFFNRVVQWLFGIHTTDTQAGIKAMNRRFALHAFTHQACPGFFFDIELFITALRHNYKHIELPVTLYLKSEKSTVRILRETVLAIFWLTRIKWLNLTGYYSAQERP